MATIITQIPQTEISIKTTKLSDIISLLPEELPWKINVWVGDKLARFGMTTEESILFLAEQENEPSSEQMNFWNNLVSSLNVAATATNDWKSRRHSALRLYNEGRLIVDKQTMCYKELVSEVSSAPILTLEEFLSKLPKEIEWKQKIYLTGSLIKNGWSGKDADLVIFDEEDKIVLSEMKRFFEKQISWRVDVGNKVMTEREPVYFYLLYDGGIMK